MDKQMQSRVLMAAFGAAAGLALYFLQELERADLLGGRAYLLALAFCASLFTAVLAMAGPLGLRRALPGALGIALATAGLLALASTGFLRIEDMFQRPQIALAGIVVTFLSMPFWIAANGPGWGDYPTLFGSAWGIVVRYGSGWAFVGLVWALLFLSDALLGIVGLTVIGDLIDLDPVPWLLTGGALGLGLAVVQDHADYVSPFLILRLLRLLLPVVFVVSVVFLLALPVRGVSGLFGQLSFALTLLAMAGAAATLVTTAVDESDAGASTNPALSLVTRATALILPVMAALGAWAVWQRVAQYGWTPDRLFAAQIAGLALGYGGLYAVAVLRGRGWMARIRQANVVMALVTLLVAVLSLTPLLSAERISTASLMARFEDGRLPVAQLDAGLLDRWGKPGAAARAELAARAEAPGQEALAARLALAAATDPVQDTDAQAAMMVALSGALPLQPAGATAERDLYLAAMDSYLLKTLNDSCARQMPGGGPACVMLVADFLPDQPGSEAVIAQYLPGGFIVMNAFRTDAAGQPVPIRVQPFAGDLPQFAGAEALMRAWQAAAPVLTPAPINQLVLPEGGSVIVLP